MRPEKVGLERVRGLEPPLRAWKAIVLPLHHTRAVSPLVRGGCCSQDLSNLQARPDHNSVAWNSPKACGPEVCPEGGGGPEVCMHARANTACERCRVIIGTPAVVAIAGCFRVAAQGLSPGPMRSAVALR